MRSIAYLINLENSHERLKHASKQLFAAGFDFERVSAFDGRSLNPLDMEEYDSAKVMSYMGRELKGAELGCYYSHLDCAQRFLCTNAHYAFVFEDDLKIVTHAKTVIETFLKWLETQNIEWYLLGISAKKQKIFTPLYEYQEYQLVHAHYFPVSAMGLVWSRPGAQAFVNQHHKIQMPVDNYFQLWLGKENKGLSVFPPLVIASGMQSDIDGAVKRQLVGRSFWYGWAKQKRLWSGKYLALKHKWFSPKCSSKCF